VVGGKAPVVLTLVGGVIRAGGVYGVMSTLSSFGE